MRGPSESLHEGPALGRGGRGKGATPQPMAGPQGRDRHPGRQEASPGDQRAPPTPPPPLPLRPKSGRGGAPPTPPPHPPSWGATGAALRPPGAEGTPPPPEGTATRWGEKRLDLLPRAQASVPEQRAQRNSMEAAPHMTLP